MIEQNEEVVDQTPENTVEEITEENIEQPVEEVVEETIDESKFESAGDPDIIKIDLDNPPQPKKEVKKETEQPVLEEITVEKTDDKVVDKVEAINNVVEETVEKSETTGQDLPENIQKVVDFMSETGGDLEDYVKLNQDYSKLDDMSLLREYYKKTKSHLNDEEISFLIDDSFNFDEEIDEERDVKRKKLAFKEQVANAKYHMDGEKSKY